MSILGCKSSAKIVESIQDEKYIYSSGNLSGIDYIMIMKKKQNKRQFWLIINCNHYVKGVGRGFYMSKEKYSLSGKYLLTVPFIKDTSILSRMNYSSNNNFAKLSDEEYQIIKTSFIKYPELTIKYALNADSLNNYLGWLEIKK